MIEVAKNLHQLATDLWEKKQENSANSSQPPSKDNPYTSTPITEESDHYSAGETGSAETELQTPPTDFCFTTNISDKNIYLLYVVL